MHTIAHYACRLVKLSFIAMACFYMHLAELRDLLHCEMQRLMRLWEGSLPRPRPHACMRTWMGMFFKSEDLRYQRPHLTIPGPAGV